jgi:hypothetical protein
MIRVSEERSVRQGRVFPERQLSPEEKAKRKAEREEMMRRCQVIFDRVQPELINDHYDWFMVIEPDSGDYFIDEDEIEAINKARDKHPTAKCTIFCINETGACCRV